MEHVRHFETAGSNKGDDMADVKWIKVATNIFDNRKIKLIESMPDADAILVIWFKLLALSGCVNDSGNLMVTDKLPYTDEMLATQFNRPVNTVRLAIQTFERFGMIKIEDNVMHISNWEKYQNVDGMKKLREQNRIRKARQREKEKALIEDKKRDCHVTVTQCHATEEDKEEDKDIDKEYIDIQSISCDYNKIVATYNSICISYPKVKSISDARKKAIKARLNTYSVDDLTKAFEKAEASDFLKGKNDRNWQANFDWMMKDRNLAKILDGNYDNKKQQPKISKANNFERRQYDMNDLESRLLGG